MPLIHAIHLLTICRIKVNKDRNGISDFIISLIFFHIFFKPNFSFASLNNGSKNLSKIFLKLFEKLIQAMIFFFLKLEDEPINLFLHFLYLFESWMLFFVSLMPELELGEG